ncbi:MAG: peptidoglycan -binding protein [Alphaproteobacteria bacterium]|nr:peptidoglycan -binding protein [Alphaproteobacteria bacterium]
MATRSYRRSDSSNIWPGFVDAISTLLIIVIFLLMIFTIAQFFLSEILSGRDNALDRLNRQIAELGEVLALEKKSNENLRQEVSQLSTELQGSIAARDKIQQSLAAMTGDRDRLAEALTIKSQELDVDREKIRVQLATLQSLKNDIDALKKVRAALETKVSSLTAGLNKSKVDLSVARDRSKQLEAKLASAEERTVLAQKEIKAKDIRLNEMQDSAVSSAKSLKDEKALSEKSRARVALLNRQIAALRQQLARISSALEASEAKARSQNVQIINLGSRLNEALASKVQELARFRSEFFGKLRDALGNTKGVRVEGDRFVFQSEVLFPSGSSSMFGAGKNQISQLAGTLKGIAERIPKDVDWILRVDGHTDNRPIKTAQFPSNWELSSARAIAVVKQLVAQGIPPHRLAATGFGEFRPLDTSPSPAGLSRNRRIEFKLTGR